MQYASPGRGRSQGSGVNLRKLLNRLFGRRWLPDSPAPTYPLTTAEVLQQEAEAIHQVDLSGRTGADLYRSLNALDSTALCLSGGGIRSAAFGLGVIQALAQHPRTVHGHAVRNAKTCLLSQFDYLSTVSGGGYIGSWLSAWRARAPFAAIWRNLIGRPDGSDVEPPTIAWLRSYSNYLTPKLGPTSADAWTVVAEYLRNLILNWLVIVPALCVGILLLKLTVVLLVGLAHFASAWRWFGASGVLLLILGLIFMLARLPSRQTEHTRAIDAARGEADRIFLLPSLALILCSAVALTDALDMLVFYKVVPLNKGILLCAVAGVVIYAASWWLTGLFRRRQYRALLAWMIAGLGFGFLVGIGFFWVFYYVLDLYPGHSAATPALILMVSRAVAPLLVGVPWILMSQFAAQMIFVGLTSHRQNQRQKFNADQEWLGRASGWLLIAAVVWTLVLFVTFAGSLTGIEGRPSEASNLYYVMAYWAVPLSAVAALAVAIAGGSGLHLRSGFAKMLSFAAETIANLAAALFVGALIFSLSSAIDIILFGYIDEMLAKNGTMLTFWQMINGLESPRPDYAAWWTMLKTLIFALAFCWLFAVTASRCVNINRFSLHEIYRNRLMRAFLGASRRRRPDPFTGFDEDDDVQMHELWPQQSGDASAADDWRPFHILNLTLNIVSAKRLAWQERKAASFSVSPLHCGTSSKSNPRNKEAGNQHDYAEGAYRPSRDYGGARGMSLGTAMAISGAAANPSMGYHSSPAITLLLTIFNLRLGWWLGNPGVEGARSFHRDGPAVAILPLAQETFGLTTETREYVNLSDGGHFDNLGLYEMVRRRCRFILVADAACDPGYGFADLGNAVRKISIDLGVPIYFRQLEVLRRRPLDGSDVGPNCDYHVLADIDYQTADDSREVENGVILYVKAGYHGTESADIRSYAMANPEFPHQSSVNQWFTESQFEAYRLLGFEIVDSILKKALTKAAFSKAPTLDNLVAALRALSTSEANDILAFEQIETSRPPGSGPSVVGV